MISRLLSERRWGWLCGLMLGVVVSHAVQPAAWLAGEFTWRPKFAVAIAGAVLYLVCLVGLHLKTRWALWIAIAGPCVGLCLVLTGWALGLGVRPDVFQAAGAVLQVPALVAAIYAMEDPDDKLRWKMRRNAAKLRGAS
jgi:hypothetical protein